MRGRTHLTVGCAAWISTSALLSSPHLAPLTLGTLTAGVGALLPDIDQRPVWRKLTGGHRHATHSMLGLTVAVVLAVVLDDFTSLPWWVPAALGLGWLTHIAADSMTIKGCPWLWPNLRSFWLLPRAARITTGGRRHRIGPGTVVRSPAYGEQLTAVIVVLAAAACCYLKWR